MMLRTPQASRANLRQYKIVLVPVIPWTACLSRMNVSQGGRRVAAWYRTEQETTSSENLSTRY